MDQIRRYICTGIIQTSVKKRNDLKEGLYQTLKGIWLSKEAIDMISILEDFNVWSGMIWEETSGPHEEHSFETELKTLRHRPD